MLVQLVTSYETRLIHFHEVGLLLGNACVGNALYISNKPVMTMLELPGQRFGCFFMVVILYQWFVNCNVLINSYDSSTSLKKNVA